MIHVRIVMFLWSHNQIDNIEIGLVWSPNLINNMLIGLVILSNHGHKQHIITIDSMWTFVDLLSFPTYNKPAADDID